MGEEFPQPQSKEFHEWVTQFALIDNPIKNVQYTWLNFRESAACSKIGWIFTSMPKPIPRELGTGLPRPVSDHCPLFLDTDRPKTCPTPFRFENMWLRHSSFKQINYQILMG